MKDDELSAAAEELRFEPDPVKGSRFVATVAPAASREEALAFVRRVERELSDASHNCWAWRVGGRGEQFQSSDAGEPGGSAGRPILAQLEGHRVTNTAVVVSRWFGGTKLGVGGLVRAYGGAAGKALDRTPLRPVVALRRLEIAHPWECAGAVQALVAARGLTVVASDYGESVRLALDVPERELAEVERELADRTAGRAAVLRGPAAFR